MMLAAAAEPVPVSPSCRGPATASPLQDSKVMARSATKEEKTPEKQEITLRLPRSEVHSVLAQQRVLIPSPRGPQSPILCLFNEIGKAIAAEKAVVGGPINNSQPLESFQRMDAQIRGLISHYVASGAEDWKDYVFWNPHHYVRNLVDANEEFELIILCWSPGQYSRIHDHQGAHCWLTGLQGTMEEVQYGASTEDKAEGKNRHLVRRPSIPGVLQAEGPCPELKEWGRQTLNVGDTGYINDFIALHSVGCPSKGPEGGVTMHLYCPPIKRATLFEPDENRVVSRVPGYFSIRGKRCTMDD